MNAQIASPRRRFPQLVGHHEPDPFVAPQRCAFGPEWTACWPGWHVTAGLWDGNTVTGYLSVDNLLRKEPFSERDCELIRLYATAVGHLISLKRVEREVRTSGEGYRMLAENMSDTIWLMDLDLKITYISPSVTRQRGYTLDELNRFRSISRWRLDPLHVS